MGSSLKNFKNWQITVKNGERGGKLGSESQIIKMEKEV